MEVLEYGKTRQNKDVNNSGTCSREPRTCTLVVNAYSFRDQHQTNSFHYYQASAICYYYTLLLVLSKKKKKKREYRTNGPQNPTQTQFQIVLTR